MYKPLPKNLNWIFKKHQNTNHSLNILKLTDAICNGSNGSDVYVPHEKIDGCKTYVRCFNNFPVDQLCGHRLCFDHQKNYSNWCMYVSSESEMSPTTEGKYMNTKQFCLRN